MDLKVGKVSHWVGGCVGGGLFLLCGALRVGPESKMDLQVGSCLVGRKSVCVRACVCWGGGWRGCSMTGVGTPSVASDAAVLGRQASVWV